LSELSQLLIFDRVCDALSPGFRPKSADHALPPFLADWPSRRRRMNRRPDQRRDGMNSDNTRRYDMLKRVCDFGAGHADVFPASSLGGKMFARVAAAVAALDEHAAARVSTDGTVRDGARAKSAAREALRDALRAVGRHKRSQSTRLASARSFVCGTRGPTRRSSTPHALSLRTRARTRPRSSRTACRLRSARTSTPGSAASRLRSATTRLAATRKWPPATRSTPPWKTR
jgi:hypothetical protein